MLVRSLVICFTVFAVFPTESLGVTMSWSLVGNPGNAADSVGPLGQHGAVGYTYSIGTYDVTNSQYVEFLNSNDPTGANTLGLFNSSMSNFLFGGIGGIEFTAGAANGTKYSVITGRGNHPVNFETWYSAARFANWLNNGQTPGATETGAYTLLGGTPTPSNGDTITRNAGASIALPSDDEQFKAAYYNPATATYFRYPTSSDLAPTPTAPTSKSNSANYTDQANEGPKNLTDVGAYTRTTSPYGAYDMGGNVDQWNETLHNGSMRGLDGGTFESFADDLASTRRSYDVPSDIVGRIGFRLVMLPEPGTGALAMIGLACLAACRRRFSRAPHPR